MYFKSFFAAQDSLFATWRWPNFNLAELACRCGGRFCARAYWHDPNFLDRLQALRDMVGKPLQVSSAHRCALWNAAVGGAPLSQHKQIAVDLITEGHDRASLRSAAERCGFTGFGLARTFLHLDTRPVPAIWYYEGSAVS